MNILRQSLVEASLLKVNVLHHSARLVDVTMLLPKRNTYLDTY